MRLAYVYDDLSVPVPKAAPIQILNTCHAAAQQGVETTVFVRKMMARSEEECLAYYGLAPHPLLRIVALAPRWAPVVIARRVRRAVGQACSGEGPVAILSRGGSGANVASALGRAAGARPWRFILELHHLRSGRPASATVAAADAVVCISRPLAEDVERLYGLDRPVLVLPSGTRVPAEPPVASTRDVDVLFAGKLGERQGIHVAVAAMSFLPSSRLLVLGGRTREVRAVREQARRAGVGERVVLEGFVPPARMPSYLARARVGVCPYPTRASAGDRATPAWNGSSLKLLDFMANGVPAVASDLPSIRDVGTHGHDVWLVEPDSPEALAEGVRTLLDDPVLAARLAAAARERATEFSWERRAARLLEFVQTLEARAVRDGARV